MLNPRNLIILKKYKHSHFEYAYTDKIFKTFISDLYDYAYSNNMDDNDYKRLFVFIFMQNIIRYLYD